MAALSNYERTKRWRKNHPGYFKNHRMQPRRLVAKRLLARFERMPGADREQLLVQLGVFDNLEARAWTVDRISRSR